MASLSDVLRQDPVRRSLVAALDATEHVLAGARRAGRRVIDEAQLRVHALRLSLDDDARAWVEEIDARAARGELRGDVTSDDLMAMLEKRRSAST